MKKLLFIALLVLLSTRLFAAEPVTLQDGRSGFFLTRADMEIVVLDLEKLNLLQVDYDKLKIFYQEDLLKIGRLEEEKKHVLPDLFLTGAICLSAGLLTGVLLK